MPSGELYLSDSINSKVTSVSSDIMIEKCELHMRPKLLLTMHKRTSL